MYNVLIDRNINLLYESLEGFSNNKLFNGRELTNQDIIDFDCDILFTRSQTKVNEELIKNTKVKLVATATTGTEHVDIDYLKQNNIEFYDAGGSNANSVAEFVVYSIIRWAIINQFNLNEKVIGIIGFGRIGKIVKYYASQLGLKILVNDPPLLENNYQFPNDAIYTELDEIFQFADIITNHVPLNFDGKHKTYKLIQEKHIEQIKDNSLLIHHSRGGVINELALIDFKEMKDLFYSIDVWENEPNYNSELVDLCEIATPHISGYSFDGKLNGAKMMLDVFKNWTGIVPNYKKIDDELSKTKREKLGSFDTYDDIFNFIEGSRKFKNDIESFKSILKKDSSNKYFDELRKKYPNKRECLIFS